MQYDLSNTSNCTTLFPRSPSGACQTLVPRNTNEDIYLFNNFFLLHCQPNNDEIKACIKDLNMIFSIDIATKIMAFGCEYFNIHNKRRPVWLTKDVFETELLKLCLTTYIVSPKHASSIHEELALLWNDIVLKHDVTIIDNDVIDVVPLIFGYIWMKIKGLYDNSFEWNSRITKGKKLNESFNTKKCTEDLKQNYIRHYIFAPDTVDALLIEMWKRDYLPLVLNSNCNLSLLQKYRHLKRKFILLDAEQKVADKIRPLHFKVFSTAADIYNYRESKELFDKICISLQGRTPVSLLSLLAENNDLMYQLRCFHILSSIEQKGLSHKIPNFWDDINRKAYINEFKAITIIGKTLDEPSVKYITRYLKKATLKESFLNLQGRQVYIFTGEMNTLNPSIKEQTVEGCIDEIITCIKSRLKDNKSSFVAATVDDSEEYWRRLSSESLLLFQIYVRNGKMELLRYKTFPSLSTSISYEGEEFEEKDFFTKTTNGTTVVSGEPGIGKSTLLRSLFKTGDSTTYSLFCDLVDYRNDLKQADSKIFEDPLNHILSKFEEFTIPNSKSSIYRNFLRSLCTAYRNKGKLILYIDSFDEILPIYKSEVFKFVRSVVETNIRIVIVSRLVADGLLINNFEVQSVQIDRLHTADIRGYFQDAGVSLEELENVPSELLRNPLYLRLLHTLHQEGTLVFNNITSFRLCKQVIEHNIKLYYLRRNEHYDPETSESWGQREDVLEVHKLLAIATIFGKETVQYEKLEEECRIGPIRLGIINSFSDGYPVFLHHIYAEFLAAEYLSEHNDVVFVRNLYQRMLDGRNIHFRHLFDSFLCDGLELHQAVIEENFEQVEHFCVKKCELLDTKDKYDRSALHLAASYCYAEETFNTKNCKILETLARYTEQRQCDLEVRDSLKGYKWYEYTKDNESLFDEARRLGLTRILNCITFPYVITVSTSENQQRQIPLDDIVFDPSSFLN
ncbi:hypothetical protein AMK59_2931 [Oryctes borbonicus]|uniref:ORC1/DEAH AAA+ ATPase domain-containing protein n=1 Tax=Oryctes borbonicus TaxID=1629725 RepID=A0A0T6BA70_9SCAR|nr:hypothetical protein AMK59_2931 [Oryctes borbonicus]